MKFFVNLPLSWAYRDKVWLELLFAHHLNPELGVDEISVNLPLSWHRNIAARIAAEGLRCSCHLPFYMTPPGTPDAAERAKSASILCRAAEIAAIYAAEHMVGHPSFQAAQDSDDTPGASSPGREFGFKLCPSRQWLENSAQVWSKVMSTHHAPLFLENTHEDDPVPVVSLLTFLPSAGFPVTGMSEVTAENIDENTGVAAWTGGENAEASTGGHARSITNMATAPARRSAMCFDAGHWFCFSRGWQKNNLENWIAYIAPHLGHLHLHDNDGGSDQHIGLGQGGIPFPRIFDLLARYGLKPTMTMEPHDLDSLSSTLHWAATNPQIQAWYNKNAG